MAMPQKYPYRAFNNVSPYLNFEDNPFEIVDGFMVRKDRFKIEEFIQVSSEKHENKYTYEETVFTPLTKKKDMVLVTCPEHGPFAVEIRAHMKGRGCPKCSKYRISKGESLIEKWFLENKIKYEKEKTFPECLNPVTGFRLRFDFYLPDRNLLIEFDGEQHYRPVDFSSGAPSEKVLFDFYALQLRDKVKNEFAMSAGLDLIRISFKSINKIPELLEMFMKQYPVLK